MADFLMVAPDGWVALDTEWYENNTELTQSWVNQTNITTVMEVSTATLIEHGDMMESQTIEEIKYIADKLWVKIVG